ncbi:MAG: hypothetical protein WC647_09625 [Desulfomonilaceae bacterium]
MTFVFLTLVGRIEQSLVDLETIVDRAETLADKYRSSLDDGYLDGVALNLHAFYSAIEKIFEDISRTIDAGVPAGPDWHRDLLLQMSAEIPGVRPPVISRHTRLVLDEFRGFRHVVRNIYTFNLRADRVIELTGRANDCVSSVQDDLHKFIDFIVKLGKAIDTD